MATERMVPIGLIIPWPLMSGADPKDLCVNEFYRKLRRRSLVYRG